MQYYYCTVGTETAVGPMTVENVGPTYISVTWTPPKYSPVKIRVNYQYSFVCEEQPYFTQQAYLPYHHVGMKLTGMKPGSVCKVTFAVFYNPSELDRGVDHLFETLQISKAYT